MRRSASILRVLVGFAAGVALIINDGARPAPAAPLAASGPAILNAVEMLDSPDATELILVISGTYSYHALRAGDDTVLIDLKGVQAGHVALRRNWPNPALTGYRIVAYTASGGQPAIRLQLFTARGETWGVERDVTSLRVVFGARAAAQLSSAKNAPPTVTLPGNVGSEASARTKRDQPELVMKGTGDRVPVPDTPTFKEPLTSRMGAEPLPARTELAAKGNAETGTAASSLPAHPAEPSSRPAPASGPGPAAATETAVPGISIKSGADGTVSIEVATTRQTPYHVYQFDHPDRIVLSVDNARYTASRSIYLVDSPLVKDVRVGQFRDKDPAVVRVVVDVGAQPNFGVHPQPNGLEIEVKPPTRSEHRSIDLPAAPSEPADSEKPSAVTTTAGPGTEAFAAPSATRTQVPEHSAVAEPMEPPIPIVKTSEVRSSSPSPAVAAKVVKVTEELPTRQPDSTPKATAPASTDPRSSAAVAPATPAPATEVDPPHPPQNPSATPAQTQLPKTAGGSELLYLEPQKQATAEGQEQPKFSGAPVSVNLKDVDLKDFFRLIHEVSGLNIVVDQNVVGSVTMVLDQVPWDQALDIVLRNNGLGKVLEGNVLRVAKLTSLGAEQDEAAALAAARDAQIPMVTVFRRLRYALALAPAGGSAAGSTSGGSSGCIGAGGGQGVLRLGLVDMITKFPGGLLSKRGAISADPRSNAVIITDIPSQIPIIQSVIDKLDTKAPQVQIEARIVLANSTFTRSLGVNLASLLLNKSGSTAAGGGTGPGSTVGVTAPATTPNTLASSGTNLIPLQTIPPAINPPPAVTVNNLASQGFGVFAISNASARYVLNAAIEAAEEHDQAKTISAPNIVTQDNILGCVLQGTQIPISTPIISGGGVVPSTSYINAALELDVTPQVTGDGNIFLIMKVQNSSPGTQLVNGNVEINTQGATTQVLVPDGGTVVFGGVKVTTRSKSANQVPVLGSIPILGHLFKSTNTEDHDMELLFFVTPRVLPG